MCRLIWHRHEGGGLPYGLRYRAGRFDPITAQLLLDEDAAGLTCATFVLAVYASCGIRLLDTNSWPDRQEDAAWHDTIVEALTEHGADDRHLAAVRAERGCARFRPEEVSGACLLESLPAPYPEAVGASARVLARLESLSASQ